MDISSSTLLETQTQEVLQLQVKVFLCMVSSATDCFTNQNASFTLDVTDPCVQQTIVITGVVPTPISSYNLNDPVQNVVF